MSGELPLASSETNINRQHSGLVGEVATSLGVQFPEVLNNLDPEYTGKTLSRYVDMGQAVERLIAEHKLPEEYRMPGLEIFSDRLARLAPSYQAFEVNGWEPDVIFVPQGLSFETWDTLLSGLELKKADKTLDKKSEGIRFMSPEALNMKDVVKAKPDDKDLWDVAVISGADQPVMMSVSANGKFGSKAAMHLEVLADLPTATEGSGNELIKKFSPEHDTYFALQLTHLLENCHPIDPNETETWTIAAETIEVDGKEQTMYYYWREPLHQICIDWTTMEYARNALGVRPTVRGRDLVPKV